MNPSGGLLWHWQAWRKQARWEPTCQDIARWLAEKDVHNGELLLIGASAGWMMSSTWLQSFRSIAAYDIDPLAAPLFRWRHGRHLRASQTQLQWRRVDALSQLDAVLHEHKKALVLFDNVLGQVRFHYPDVDEAEHRLAAIRRRLRGRHWGSIHDAYSGPVRTRASQRQHIAMQFAVQAAPKGRRGHPRASFAQFGGQLDADGAWLDHLTSELFPAGTRIAHIAWPFLDDYYHWLQAGWMEPQ